MENSWLDSILNAAGTGYDAWQQRNQPAAPAPAAPATSFKLPTWALPAGIGLLALLIVGFLFTRGK